MEPILPNDQKLSRKYEQFVKECKKSSCEGKVGDFEEVKGKDRKEAFKKGKEPWVIDEYRDADYRLFKTKSDKGGEVYMTVLTSKGHFSHVALWDKKGNGIYPDHFQDLHIEGK